MENKEFEEAIANGISKATWRGWKLLMIASVVLVVTNYFSGHYDKDSTDSDSERSGLVLHTDNKTGCQYLSSRSGLIKRTDILGKHICT